MFGSHRRCVRRCECETLMPKPGPLPHTSHTAATPNTTCRKFATGPKGPTRAVVIDPTRAGQPPQGTDPSPRNQILAEPQRSAANGGGSGCTMVPMISFDADLVRGWFARVRDADHPVMPHWGIVPTEQELAALADGERQVECAVQDLPAPTPDATLTEVPARLLRRYLHALAAGISRTRQM